MKTISDNKEAISKAGPILDRNNSLTPAQSQANTASSSKRKAAEEPRSKSNVPVDKMDKEFA